MKAEEITVLAGHRIVSPWVMKLCMDVANAECEACAKSLEDSVETAGNFQAKVLIEWCATHIREKGNL
jgi:hypothetical protein